MAVDIEKYMKRSYFGWRNEQTGEVMLGEDGKPLEFTRDDLISGVAGVAPFRYELYRVDKWL